MIALDNFQGWLIRTPTGILPNRFIAHEGYVQIPDAIMDLDPKRTGKGLLIRHPLPYVATTIKITTPFMSMGKKIEFQKYFPKNQYDNIVITYWNEKLNSYKTGNFYIPEPEWAMYGFLNGTPYYLSTTLELIGYGEKR